MLRPNSLATDFARSAKFVGVMNPPGSFARSRVKFIDSPITRPRSAPASNDFFDLALLFVFSAILVRFEQAHDRAHHDCLRDLLDLALSPRRNGYRLHVLTSQKAHCGPAHLRHLRRFVGIAVAAAD